MMYAYEFSYSFAFLGNKFGHGEGGGTTHRTGHEFTCRIIEAMLVPLVEALTAVQVVAAGHEGISA